MDDLVRQFNAAQVRYLLAGGHAMRLNGMPRGTLDWDFFIPPNDLENFRKLNELLAEELREDIEPLGQKGEGFIQTFPTQWGVLQFHLLLPGIPSFEVAEAVAVFRTTEEGTPVRCLNGKHLLASKLAANRPQDQLDIEFLRERERLGLL